MLRGKKVAAAAAAASLLAVAACSSSGTGDTGGANGNAGSGGGKAVDIEKLPTTPVDGRVGKSGGTFRLAIGEPTAIDPFNASDSDGQLITKNLFDTLTTVTPDGKLTNLLAKSISHNEACTDWTFTLKDNQKFSNGEVVDAESIKRGMIRTAIGTAASDLVYQLDGIKGLPALAASKEADPSKADFSGVAANGTVLKIALTAPDCDFDLRTAQLVYSPVPKEAGAASNTKYNDQPIGNGPFMMSEPWQHDKSITLVRNPNYTDGPAALLDKVSVTIKDGSDSSFEDKGFQAGAFDYARVVPDDIQTLANKYSSSDQDENQFIKSQSFGVNYLVPITENPPLNSVKAREAVSYAIDRDAIIKGVLKDSVTKATSLIPPPFAGQGTYQPGICASCEMQDKEKAQTLAKEAGLPPGSKVNLAYNTGFGQEGWIQAVAGMLTDVLGWDVNVIPTPAKDLAANAVKPNASGLVRESWGADYPSAYNFLSPLLGTQPADNRGDNRSRYSNKVVDQLLAEGQAEPDATKRADFYKQAEKVAIGQDLALIPIWYRTQYRVFNKAFVGVNVDFYENPTLRTIGLK